MSENDLLLSRSGGNAKEAGRTLVSTSEGGEKGKNREAGKFFIHSGEGGAKGNHKTRYHRRVGIVAGKKGKKTKGRYLRCSKERKEEAASVKTWQSERILRKRSSIFGFGEGGIEGVGEEEKPNEASSLFKKSQRGSQKQRNLTRKGWDGEQARDPREGVLHERQGVSYPCN